MMMDATYTTRWTVLQGTDICTEALNKLQVNDVLVFLFQGLFRSEWALLEAPWCWVEQAKDVSTWQRV